MISPIKKVRALGLSSGGLDSILAALVLRQQGIEVEWISFETPFFSSEKALKAAQTTQIPLTLKNITKEYMAMLKNPPCGYGQHMNPCLDCHVLMFRLAGDIMKEKGIDFVFSGEVLGQRPMSQTKPSLRYVEKHSGIEGYILRPLSAKRLPETIPEKERMVKRELLLEITGRSRKQQLKLAQEFGITEYPAPGGGCLLTDKGYVIRLKDFFDHQDTWTENELHLLKYGRHFRLENGAKIIVGRNKRDNENILTHHNPETDTVINIEKFPGPMVLIPNASRDESILLAASLCADYSKAPNNKPVDALIISPCERKQITVIGIPSSAFKHLLL